MKKSFKIPDHRRLKVLNSLLQLRLVLLSSAGGILLLAASGCVLVPPILFRKASVHGYVRDTDGNPMTNVLIETRSHPPRLLPFTSPSVRHQTKSGRNGRWSYSERKVGLLYVEAVPPSGYMEAREPVENVPQNYAGPFRDGDCPTNDFILLLKKLPVDPDNK